MMRIEQAAYRGVEFQSAPAQENETKVPVGVAKAGDLIDLTSPLKIENAGGDVREDRIAEVRERIASGFYNQANVRGEIASAFLSAQGVG